MTKISALEAYKISIVLEEFVQKLTFLDLLKANMGDEMSEN
jgi:predicted transcriptional regulator YheO